MFEKLRKIGRNELKGSNLKTFLFFLAFSVLVWFLVQFSKQYTEILSLPVQFENYPKDKIIAKTGAKLEMRVHKSGFQLAWFRLFGPKIKIDLSKLPSDNRTLVYTVGMHRDELIREMPGGFNNADFLDKAIRVPYQQKAVKIVPIKPRISISYAPGYSYAGELKLSPDSVKISGPRNELDSIAYIYTKPIQRTKVKDSLSGEARLVSSRPDITLYQNTVNFSMGVLAFTEREVSLPITLINAPDGIDISLYPSNVKLTFMVSLDKFDQVQSSDFEVVCDFAQTADNPLFFIPKISRKPLYVRNIRLSPRKIQYVIKR